jgi:hypothetical protein
MTAEGASGVYRWLLVVALWCCSAAFSQVPATQPAVHEVLEKATRAAKSALDGNVKKETLPMLAELWVDAEHADAAPRIRELVDAAGGFVDGLKRAIVMVQLARFQVRAGDGVHALETLARAKRDADGAVWVVTSDYWTYFWSEMPGPAVIRTRTYTRDDLVAEMDRLRAEIEGHAPQTEHSAATGGKTKSESVPPPESGTATPKDAEAEEALHQIARIESRDGSWNEVLASIKLVKSPLKRIDFMCRAAEAAKRVGDTSLASTAYDAAQTACSRMNIFAPKDRTAAFVRLAASMTSTGNVVGAKKIVGNLLDARARGQVKRLIAYVETNGGDGVGAMKWVESEWVADARVYGLIGVAEAILGKGYPHDYVH